MHYYDGRINWRLETKSMMGRSRHLWVYWSELSSALDPQELAAEIARQETQNRSDAQEVAEQMATDYEISQYERLTNWSKPRWSLLGIPPREVPPVVNDWNRPSKLEDARGWPFLCFGAVLEDRVNDPTGWPGRSTWHGGIGLRDFETWPDAMDQTRVIPFTPIWPGLLLNTLFYATLWSILLFVPHAIRRYLRTKHHRCPPCNYDLRNLPTKTCPECGTQT